MTECLIIAEAGVNHNGDLGIAKKLVAAAKSAGADIVKFQTFKADNVATESSPKAAYQLQGLQDNESQVQMLRKLELDEFAHDSLIHCCNELGIEFLSTAFDQESVDFLFRKGLRKFKVPSGELTNLPYLQKIAQVAKEIILSTGMANMEEIAATVKVFETAGISRNHITILHCVTDYPAKLEDVNIRAMNSIAQVFGVNVGYSDHTTGIEASLAAVAMGACVVEKHFTLDKSSVGPDHAASLDPEELRNFVQSIRNLEATLGDGIKRPTAAEIRNTSHVRKSIVASKKIMRGEEFSIHNLCTKRPGYGISPMRIDEVLGQKACRNFLADEIIELEPERIKTG